MIAFVIVLKEFGRVDVVDNETLTASHVHPPQPSTPTYQQLINNFHKVMNNFSRVINKLLTTY